jgi:hypothetical protein
MKYIVVKCSKGEELLFAFPVMVDHDRMMEMIRGIRIDEGMRNWRRDFIDAEVVSAGFIDGNGICYGRSETLNKGSRGAADTGLFMKTLNKN